jgi:hypothetical protein
MGRIQDYQHFAASKASKQPRGEYGFVYTLGQTDIYLENVPDEAKDISDVSATIEYTVETLATKQGIESMGFRVDMIELVLSLDRYPNGTEEIDLDIAPGQNIEPGRIRPIELERLIPTFPTKIEINMGKSLNISNFIITVFFGNE